MSVFFWPDVTGCPDAGADAAPGLGYRYVGGGSGGDAVVWTT
jgi:hypothetical protein